jgi:hypothetical protein
MSIDIECPHCHHRHVASVQITVETSRRAAKRPPTPECVGICPACHAVLIFALSPARREDVTS